MNRPGAESLKQADWIKPTDIADRSQVSFLLGTLDRGEAEVLALARELIEDLRRKNFRVSDRIVSEALKRAGE